MEYRQEEHDNPRSCGYAVNDSINRLNHFPEWDHDYWIADIDQVISCKQQFINRFCDAVVVEYFLQKHGSVFIKQPSHPNGNKQDDGGVNTICE